MSGAEDRPDGTIRVHFADNTYNTVAMRYDTPVAEVVERLCKRLSSSGSRQADPERHELIIVAPGSNTLRERLLLREDRPLQIQRDAGGPAGFKFVFREVRAAASTAAPAALPPSASLSPGEAEEGRDGVEAPEGRGDGAPPPPPLAPAVQLCPRPPEGGGQPAGSPPVAVPVADSTGRLRRGSLERLLEDGATWHPCTAVLDEDRLWYSRAPSASDGGVGGGMAALALCECDRVSELEDKRQFQVVARGGATITFRAKSGSEQAAWLLAVARQAALVKERDILLQADRIIAGVELRKATRQLAALDGFSRLSTVLSGDLPAKRLFLDFVRSEHAAATVWWPDGLTVEGLLACLETLGACAGGAPADAEVQAAWAFAEGPLFARFQEHPSVRFRLCRIAAGLA